ncbi:N-acetyltransferase- GNAT family [Apiospora arundinis]|uniref:DUF1772 domain-containing protein n=1 Tax=Apiospora arundinis TaxID=335852 RepID=A0ABR2IE95_9PEZI
MSLAPTPLNLAALGCIVSGSCATGIGASVSFLVMPALIRPDVPQDALIHQWHGIYKRGAALMPVLGASTALGYWLVAYRSMASASEWRGFAAAGVLTLAIVPFTLAVMMPTIRALEAEMAAGAGIVSTNAKDSSKTRMSRGTVEALLGKWTRLNVVRSLIPLVGTACAVWNLLG